MDKLKTLLVAWAILASTQVKWQIADSLLQELSFHKTEKWVNDCVRRYWAMLDDNENWDTRYWKGNEEIVIESLQQELVLIHKTPWQNLYMQVVENNWEEWGRTEMETESMRVLWKEEIYYKVSNHFCDLLWDILWIKKI